MSRELGVSSYEGDITEEATEPLLIELMQDSRGMGRIRHLCRGWHGASLDMGKRGQGESQRLTELRSGASEAREKNGGQLEAGQNLLEGGIPQVTEIMVNTKPPRIKPMSKTTMSNIWVRRGQGYLRSQ